MPRPPHPSKLAVRPPRAAWLPALAAALAACGGAGPRAGAHPQPRSTIDPAIQRIAGEELDRAFTDFAPEAGWVIALEPGTGAIRAIAARDGTPADADLPRTRAVVTGSTLKPLTYAAAFDAGAITADLSLDCAPRAYGDRTLTDASTHGTLTVAAGLEVSSNVCASRVLDRIGLARLLTTLRALHLGDPPAPLPAIADPAGYDAAMFAAGELHAATPLQLVAAYGALFADGTYAAPTLDAAAAPARERALSPEAAHAVVALLEGVVTAPDGTGHQAAVPGHRVAGKTGTAMLGPDRTYASFVGRVLDGPDLVILVGLVAPRDEGGGGDTAAPTFARIATRLLAAPTAPAAP
ncbi:MAG TPA: penicillin-binding transpeptidase domain-containing protein [Kofleriaceae bacterium]|nr:penicillin-binding transpeptidase domain-containing protein [Kofleriaceae bacterium]